MGKKMDWSDFGVEKMFFAIRLAGLSASPTADLGLAKYNPIGQGFFCVRGQSAQTGWRTNKGNHNSNNHWL